MGKAKHWMPLHVGEYLANTNHLSTAEHGAYLLLSMHYWEKGGLPESEESIRRVTRMSPRQWSHSRDVLRSFFRDGWRHPYLDRALAQVLEKSRVNSTNVAKRYAVRSQSVAVSKPIGMTESRVKKEEEKTPPYSPPSGGKPTPAEERPKKSAAKTPWPEGFAPHHRTAEGLGWPPERIAAEFEHFHDKALARGYRYEDWQRAWNAWCRSSFQQPSIARQPESRHGAANGGVNGKRAGSILDILDREERELQEQLRAEQEAADRACGEVDHGGLPQG